MDIVLCTKEYADEHALRHYRVGGEKKGVRRWQNKDGSLTPEGYQHYKEMYEWGDRKKGIGDNSDFRSGTLRGSHETSWDTKSRMHANHGGIDPETHHSNAILSHVKIPVEKLEDIKRLDGSEDMDQVLRDINHRRQEETIEIDGDYLDDTGRKYNCPNCACAFEMVQRGYDVVARRAPDGSNVGDIEQNFKGAHLESAGVDWNDNPIRLSPTPKRRRERTKFLQELEEYGQQLSQARDEAVRGLRRTLEKQGAGARGIIVVGWLSDSSLTPTSEFHALNYKIGDDGIMMLYDTQSYWRSTGTYDLGSLYGCDPRELHYMRTDNLELDDRITERVYSRGRGDK